MGSELRCQNFDLMKFQEIIPINPCYVTFFSRNFESEFSKSSDPPAEPKLKPELWPNSDTSLGLDNFVRTVNNWCLASGLRSRACGTRLL